MTGLSPGTRYEITARGYRGRFTGPEYVTLATTAGQPPAAVANFTAELSLHSNTLVRLSWRPPPPTDGSSGAAGAAMPLQYGVFWGTSMEELYDGGVRQRTAETSTQVGRSGGRKGGRLRGVTQLSVLRAHRQSG